jgi:hypothetical protein
MPKRHRIGRAGIPIGVFSLRSDSKLGPDDHIDAGPENQRTGQ